MREQVDLAFYIDHPTVRCMEATRLQGVVAYETIRNRGMRGLRQYGQLFGGMVAYGFKEPVRAALIRSSYAWFRDGDDILDKDKPLPANYASIEEFSQVKRNLISRVVSLERPIIGDRVDILLVDYFSLAKRLNIDLLDESLAIWDTMELDASRAAERRVLTEAELNDYFNKLDFACIGGALKVAGEQCDSQDLSDLSWAVRIMFNARDFPSDFAKGIVNISQEEIASYGVDLSELEGRKTVGQLVGYEPMMNWYKEQVKQGTDFLQKARISLGRLDFKWETRYAINRFFVRPTQSTLDQYAEMIAA